ncbi:MAG: sigma-70 family RNA polymerase sigma factor [Bacillota bacterium]
MINIWNKLKMLIIEASQKFRGCKNGVDYIVALPTPLNSEEESELVAQSEQGNLTARNTLVERNLRLVVYIAKRFDNTGMDIEELISVGSLGLIKAVKSYDSQKKIKLATYASRCIENEILMYLRKMVKTRYEVSLDEPLNVDFEGNKLLMSDVLGTESDMVFKEFESNAEKKVLRSLFMELNKRDRMIICMRYGLYGVEERTQKDIADMLKISQSYISRLEKKIVERMKCAFSEQFSDDI